MSGRISLGLVSEIIKDEKGNFEKIKTDDWNAIYDYFVNKGYEVSLFDWKNVDQNLNVEEHLNGFGEERVFKQKKSNLNDLCDLIYIGQLGNIHQNKESFLGFLESMKNFEEKSVNPIETIEKNLSKQYLLDLYDKGFPVVPSIGIDSSYSLKDISNLNVFTGSNLDDIVLKPKVFGEKGEGVTRLSKFRDEDEFHRYLSSYGEVIAQPFIKDIETNGENSYIFVDGEFSHGLNKISGKFKVNESNSTIYTSRNPSESEKNICKEVLYQWPDKNYYVRFDFINSDPPLINEVEMVNPAGYLEDTNSSSKYLGKLNEVFKKIV